MYKIIILPLAVRDIKETAFWYNKKQPGLGKKFTAAIREKVNIISKTPEIFAIKYQNSRTAMLTSFPYLVHYAVDSNINAVIISAVLSTDRNPQMWKLRK